jgi:hypothetical protein
MHKARWFSSNHSRGLTVILLLVLLMELTLSALAQVPVEAHPLAVGTANFMTGKPTQGAGELDVHGAVTNVLIKSLNIGVANNDQLRASIQNLKWTSLNWNSLNWDSIYWGG